MARRPRRRVFRPSDATDYDRTADRPDRDAQRQADHASGDDRVAPVDEAEADVDGAGAGAGGIEEGVDRLLDDRPPHYGPGD